MTPARRAEARRRQIAARAYRGARAGQTIQPTRQDQPTRPSRINNQVPQNVPSAVNPVTQETLNTMTQVPNQAQRESDALLLGLMAFFLFS